MTLSKKEESSFVDKATNAMPKWAWGGLGTFIGVMMTLQVTGYNAPLQRYIDANVDRITRSADQIDASAAIFNKRMNAIEGGLETLDKRMTAVERHQAAVDAQFHKGAK